MAIARQAETNDSHFELADVKLESPVTNPAKILAIGLKIFYGNILLVTGNQAEKQNEGGKDKLKNSFSHLWFDLKSEKIDFTIA